MQNPIRGGPYSVISAGKRNGGAHQSMYQFNDLDHLQADLLGIILKNVAAKTKNFGEYTLSMSQSEINECIIDTVSSRLPRGSVCLTKFDLKFMLADDGDSYSFTFVDLKTDYNTKSFILRDPKAPENVAWQARIKHMTYEWLAKVLEARGIRFVRDPALEAELRKQTAFEDFAFPQENMTPIVGFVHYREDVSVKVRRRRRRGSVVVLGGSEQIEALEWSD